MNTGNIELEEYIIKLKVLKRTYPEINQGEFSENSSIEDLRKEYDRILNEVKIYEDLKTKIKKLEYLKTFKGLIKDVKFSELKDKINKDVIIFVLWFLCDKENKIDPENLNAFNELTHTVFDCEIKIFNSLQKDDELLLFFDRIYKSFTMNSLPYGSPCSFKINFSCSLEDKKRFLDLIFIKDKKFDTKGYDFLKNLPLEHQYFDELLKEYYDNLSKENFALLEEAYKNGNENLGQIHKDLFSVIKEFL